MMARGDVTIGEDGLDETETLKGGGMSLLQHIVLILIHC